MNNISNILLILFIAFSFLSCDKENPKSSNEDSIIEGKIDSIISIMTLEEKIGQTVIYTSDSDVTGPVLDKNYQNYLRNGGIGAIFNATGAAFTRKLQTIAIEETRLGIPLLFGYDVIHGHKTIFPIPMGEASSWDLDLMQRTARVSAIEASAEGLHWTFAPMVDVARDARWGRISEGAGEDTYLCSLISAARVRGFQGDNLNETNTILACAKHFAAYGAAQSGRDYHTVDISENTLWNVYLPPFKKLVEENVATFMTSFNELNGVPATGNKYLLKDVLRDKWNFNGFVVTDYTSINEMVHHGFARDLKHAGELAINAGVDMDMQGGVFLNETKKSVEEKKIDTKTIDNAVRNILRQKFKLGLFDNPYKYSDEKKEKELILNEKHLELAREAAKKSIVLLKNNNDVLPLKKDAKVALIGPLADDEFHIIGNWAGRGDRNGTAVSVKEGFDNQNINYSFSKGCEIEGGNTSKFSEALKIAKKSEVVVMVLGESERMSGEAASRSNIKIPGLQQELIKEIKKAGKPIVLVLMNGRPLDLSWEDENVDAIVETWFAGTSGGHGITDVLFGYYNPSAKLTVTFPRNIGQIPIFYNMKNTGRPADIEGANDRYVSKYIDVDNSPLYPFGYGLSYTTFKYGETQLSTETLSTENTIKVTTTITNSGKYDGEEIVQLYVKDIVGSITRPVKELIDFRKIFIKKGETKEVIFEINPDKLKFYNNNLEFVNENGDYQLVVAPNSNKDFTNKFTLTIK